MKKSLWLYGVVPHVLGSAFAIALAWYLPTWINLTDPRPAQIALTVVAVVLCCWVLYKIVTGKDSISNKSADFFDKKNNFLNKKEKEGGM